MSSINKRQLTPWCTTSLVLLSVYLIMLSARAWAKEQEISSVTLFILQKMPALQWISDGVQASLCFLGSKAVYTSINVLLFWRIGSWSYKPFLAWVILIQSFLPQSCSLLKGLLFTGTNPCVVCRSLETGLWKYFFF